MKVYNLRCPTGHTFEGWFGSEQDFADQCERKLLACPFCDSTAVLKAPSAPRLNLRSTGGEPSEARGARPLAHSPEAAPTQDSRDGAGEVLSDAGMRRWLELSRQLVRGTEDVGARFAQEARRMHYGEVESRGIRGNASSTEVEALLDEGIEVLPVLLPAATKATLQ